MGLNQRLVTDLIFKAGNPAPLLSPNINEIESVSDIPSIQLGSIPPGATVIAQHGLYQSLLGPAEPTIVFPDRASPLRVIAADKFTVTIFNPDLANAQDAFFRCERKHTIEEDPDLLVKMLWNGLPGAASSNVQEFSSSGCVLPGTTIVRISTDTEEPQIYLAPVDDGADGRLITFRITSGFLDAILLPADLADGINGPPGSSYTFSPQEAAVTFEADVAARTWWKV
jgi:hypothetical protein